MIGCGHGLKEQTIKVDKTPPVVSPPKLKTTTTATPNIRTAKRDSICDNDRFGSSVCETYVANIWPVASVRSQNAVQHIVIWSALTIDTM